MIVLRRCLSAALAVTLGIGFALSSSAPTHASGGTPASNGATGRLGGSHPAAPIDQSGLTFSAFRSYGLPIVPGEPFWLSVLTMVPVPPMYYAELVGDEEIFIGAPTWQDAGTVSGVPHYIANLLIEEPTEGTHTYLAVFLATDQFDELRLRLDVAVELATMTITVATDANPVQTHHQIVLYPELDGGGTGFELTGEFEWRDADSGALLSTRPANDYFLTIGSLAIGVYHFTVRYTGDPSRAAVTSPIYMLRVTADIVEASGVGIQYPRFYPVTDGYRDTVRIKGTRLESLSVGIRISGPTGATVRTATMAAAGGAYSYAWNGRNAAGKLLPAGRYKIVQTLTDGFGTKENVTSFVFLKHNKLVTKTVYVTRDGSAISAQGSGGGGSVTLSESDGYAKLVAGSGWASAGWEFFIPAAVVYNSVAIEVYTNGGFSIPPTQLGIQNFATCPRTSEWDVSCFDRWTVVGNASASKRWYSTSGSSSEVYRSRRYVRGVIVVDFGTVYVYKARAKVVYQVLDGPADWGGVVVGR